MKLTLVRFEEGAEGTNGRLMSSESGASSSWLTIEKPWRGNLPFVSRIAPKLRYKIIQAGESSFVVVNVVNNAALKGRDAETISIVPWRDVGSMSTGSIGIVKQHTGLGKGFGPDAPFAQLADAINKALATGEDVWLEVRA